MQPEQQENYWQNPEEGQAFAVTETSTVDTATAEKAPLAWEASEYVQSEKSALWTLAVIGVSALLVLVAAFLVRSWSFVALVVVMAITLIIMGRRQPRIISYRLTSSTLHIAEKTYNLHEFRSFGVVQEGAFYSVRLIPTKRFMPAVSLYFPTEMGEQIVDILALSLPMQRIEPDLMDKFLEKIHF